MEEKEGRGSRIQLLQIDCPPLPLFSVSQAAGVRQMQNCSERVGNLGFVNPLDALTDELRLDYFFVFRVELVVDFVFVEVELGLVPRKPLVGDGDLSRWLHDPGVDVDPL